MDIWIAAQACLQRRRCIEDLGDLGKNDNNNNNNNNNEAKTTGNASG